MIWGNDGWCYIPDLKMRQKFTENKYFSQSWDGVIAMPEHIETVEWSLYSKEPLVWSENQTVFSAKTSRHNTS